MHLSIIHLIVIDSIKYMTKLEPVNHGNAIDLCIHLQDVSQTTIPFIDLQEVRPNPPVWLRGYCNLP